MLDYLDRLPTVCYGTLPTTGETIVIKKGEAGYYPAPIEVASRPVDELNTELGVSKAQARAMLNGSMFGWEIPAANPALYDWREGPCFYVSIIDGTQYLFAAGPFQTHEEALALVPLVETIAAAADPRAPFWAYGTATAPDGKRQGSANEAVAALLLGRFLQELWQLPA